MLLLVSAAAVVASSQQLFPQLGLTGDDLSIYREII